MISAAKAMQDALTDDRFRQWDEIIHWQRVKILMHDLAIYLYDIQIIQLEKKMEELQESVVSQ